MPVNVSDMRAYSKDSNSVGNPWAAAEPLGFRLS